MEKTYKKIFWVIGIYLLIVFISKWIGLSSLGSALDALATILPSIGMLSKEAHDVHAATFELTLAWLISFVFAFFYPLKMDWAALESRAISMGGKVKTGIKLIAASLIVFFALLYPHTPSATGKYGIIIRALLKNDSAYVLGLGVLLVSFIAWFGMIAGIYLLYKSMLTQGKNYG